MINIEQFQCFKYNILGVEYGDSNVVINPLE